MLWVLIRIASHNIRLYGELTKTILKLSQNTPLTAEYTSSQNNGQCRLQSDNRGPSESVGLDTTNWQQNVTKTLQSVLGQNLPVRVYRRPRAGEGYVGPI